MPPVSQTFCVFSFFLFCKGFFKRFLCFSLNRPTEKKEMSWMLNEKKKRKKKKGERKEHGL